MRVTFRNRERRHWENWLKSDLADRLENKKNLVAHLYSTKSKYKPLVHFTPHGIDHCQAVEDNIHRLIPLKLHKKLGESEKFFLLASAWLHDIGMLRGLTGKDEELGDDFIRDTHHLRSEEHIANFYDEVGVKEEEAAAFGMLSLYHRRRCDIAECPAHLTLPNHGTIRPQLLAAYLRMADALHIDSSRTPEKKYAISLAYNIPYKSKLHWYRSRFVMGVEFSYKCKEIVIHLKKPSNKDSSVFKNANLDETYETIYNLIIQDLTEELDSIKNTLFKAGISYYLKITKKVHLIQVDNRFLRDIKPVLSYYHLLDNPSSSALLSLVLESISIIIELDTVKSKKSNIIPKQVKKNLKQFILEINENVLSTRKCHIGLSNFVDHLSGLIEKDNIVALEKWINKQQKTININRRKIRATSCRYFDSLIKQKKPIITPVYSNHWGTRFKKGGEASPDVKVNILLYGYSELVMKSLCGFRDAVIRQLIESYYCSTESESESQAKTPLYHRLDIEKYASSYFRIFCCEGQPKNHTTWTGRLHHHDGARYALSLAELRFDDIYIIPDAVATSLVSSSGQQQLFPQINFVMIGTNGFDESRFRHSAGHSMVVAAVLFAKRLMKSKKEKAKPPTLILSLLTDKFNKYPKKEDKKRKSERFKTIGGWPFSIGFGEETVRLHSFFTQDHDLQKDIISQDEAIHFYNPREDSIAINLVDVILTEKCFLEKKAAKNKKYWKGSKIIRSKRDNKY